MCPSVAATLGTFAAVNVLVTLFNLIFGDRRVIHILTCGFLGGATGHAWIYMFILPLGTQLGADALIAYLYSRAPGYGANVPIGQLVLFFTTRPRLGHLVLSILMTEGRKQSGVVPRRTGEILENGYYEASARGSLLAEIVLVLISAYYKGKTVHFAASKGYYILGHLKVPHGHDAYIMYAGALLSLVTMVLTIMWLAMLVMSFRQAKNSNAKYR